MEKGAWRAVDHGITESDLTERLSTHTYMGSALEFFKTFPGDSNVQTILRILTIQGVELQGTFYIIHFYSVWTFCQILHCCCCLVTKSSATPWTVCSLPGSSVHRILQARILEWAAIPSSKGSPDPGIEPRSLALQTDSLLSEPLGNFYLYTKHSSRNHSLENKTAEE